MSGHAQVPVQPWLIGCIINTPPHSQRFRFMTPECFFFFFYPFQILRFTSSLWTDAAVSVIWYRIDRESRKNIGHFANLLLLKWAALHLSRVFSLSKHVCQLAFVSARKRRRDEGKGKGELSSSRCSLAKRQKREPVGSRCHNHPSFVFTSSFLLTCVADISLQLQSCCKATPSVALRLLKWGGGESNLKETKTRALWEGLILKEVSLFVDGEYCVIKHWSLPASYFFLKFNLKKR